MHPPYPTPMQYSAPIVPPYPTGPSAAGRRAAIMMWVLGGILFVMSATSCVHSILLSPDQYHQVIQEQMKVAADSGFPAAGMPFSESVGHTLGSVFDGIFAAIGLTAVWLAFGVRRGRRGQTLAAAVMVSVGAVLLAVLIIFLILASLVAPAFLMGAAMLMLPAIPLVLLAFQLFSALRRPAPGTMTGPPWQMTPPVQAAAWMPYGAPVSPYPTAPTPPAMAPVLGYGYPGIAPPPPPPPPPSSPQQQAPPPPPTSPPGDQLASPQ